ncbi:SCO2522 family protein [Micromonospora sp. B11E3]|uniref:SCO2522 family protein n=1 Tax=Micromonospora sp. B11E3 TaxID=3153562 RepID=UPI00325CC94E
MRADAEFFESTADARVESIPLSHLSIELGHFYSPDLSRDVDFFADHFRRIARWSATARAACRDAVQGKTARISTCVLIDDYFGQPESPRTLLPKLLAAAREGGLELDYLARESGCADPVDPADADPAEPADDAPAGLSLAELVEARIVEDPPPDSTGARPPVHHTGWLCNGQRSPATDRHEAMKRPSTWLPPAENAAVNHSIFADIELWRDGERGRQWSCAMLAAVWQLLRLGVLRDKGRRVAVPRPLPDELPDDWRRLPAVLRLNERAAPFSAYRTMTICAPLFLPIENAVRTIMQQVAVDPAVLDQLGGRGADEGIALPPAVVDRIEYLFVDTGPVHGAGPG